MGRDEKTRKEIKRVIKEKREKQKRY